MNDQGPGVGRFAIASGLALALLPGIVLAQPQMAAPAFPAPATQMKVLSATFAVADLARSTAFYTNGLGLSAGPRIENARNSEIPLLFPGGGVSLLIIQWKDAAGRAAAPPRLGRVILDIPDLRALEKRLNAAGYKLRAPIVDNKQHHVMVAVVEDPDGNELELVQRSR